MSSMMNIFAGELVKQHGDALVGRQVITAEMGAYPGGVATIIEVNPDPAANIAFTVEHPTWTNPDSGNGQIGVFDYEYVVEL